MLNRLIALFVFCFPVLMIAMDLVQNETGAAAAREKYALSGNGVLVAVFDRGIDWKNPDFRNPDGSTRIEAIYDLTNPSGINSQDNAYGRGTIFSEGVINEALSNGKELPTRDAIGHGVTTAGIAAGSGIIDPKFVGIAPKARLLIVKLVSDGAPAHGDEAAEGAFFESNLTELAIDFTLDTAERLGMPCVMLLNIGSVGGPTDGTSRLARKIDSSVGKGVSGRVFVTGTSDDGGANNRAHGIVTHNDTASIEISKNESGPLVFDLWYSESDRLSVRITTPRGMFGPFPAPLSAVASDMQTTTDFVYHHLGQDVDFHEAQNGKRQIWIRFDGPQGRYSVELEGTQIRDGQFDATLNPSRFRTDTRKINEFRNFTMEGSIWDLAAAMNNICPNSYVIRREYRDIDGAVQLLNEGALGDLWRGSGIGPTFDGRIGVDISAPGDSVFTTYGENAYWSTFRWNLLQGFHGRIGRAAAVSAANPIVTGIIALMLEMDPTLDAIEVRDILRSTATTDRFTGEVPNIRWGYGKVNALAALDRVHQRLMELRISRANNSTFRLTASGRRGFSYEIQRSSDFNAWFQMFTFESGKTPIELEIPGEFEQQYYRLVRVDDNGDH